MTVSDAVGMQQQPGLLCELYHSQCCLRKALSNPKTPIYIQKCPFYNENLNLGMPGDSKNAFLHWSDVLGCSKYKRQCAGNQVLGIFCMALGQHATAANTACNINIAACMQCAGM